MAPVDKEIFTFNWEIENFSMCPHQFNERLVSPTFIVDCIEKTAWKLVIYPRGSKKTNHVACYLERSECGNCIEDVAIGFALTGLSIHTDKYIEREVTDHVFTKNGDWGYGEFSTREHILNAENGFLQNDTLCVKCQMWKVTEESKNTRSDVLDSNDCGSKDCMKSNQCSAVTRIKVRSKSVLWPVKKFSSLRPNEKLIKTMESAIEGEPSFDMTFFLDKGSDGERYICVEVQRIDEYGENELLFVRGKIKTLGVPRAIQHQTEDEHFFIAKGEDDVWEFPTFINIKDLTHEEHLSYTGDVLFLYCEFFFSVPGEQYAFKNNNFTCPVYHLESRKCFTCPRSDYMRLYKNGIFSDVTIKVGTKSFKVHKNILGMRSDVFNAMFESDMQEKESGIVNIIDFDAETMDRLFSFIYTDIMDDLSQEEAAKLYAAADKYNVIPLKYRCCCILMSTLSVSTVCQVLTFADTHQDEDLLEIVRSFIHMNAHETFHSQNWIDFMQSNSRIAAETMHYVFTKKFININ